MAVEYHEGFRKRSGCLEGYLLHVIWTDEADSAALKLNELDPSEGSHSVEAALCVAFRDYENLWSEQNWNKIVDCTCSPTGVSKCRLSRWRGGLRN
jgi:hypothetical protein